MNGKVVMVTGATNGIGKVAALELARMGAQVIVVGRNQQRCESTAQEIKIATGNESVEYLVADLSSLQEIHKLADEFKAKHNRLDVLLNNAGAMFVSRQESIDGYEMTLALNHLNYFLLTQLLLDVLNATAGEQGESRIVNVSSDAHRQAPSGIDFDDIQRLRRFSRLNVYGETKLMNILFTYELAKRLEGTGVMVNALHPGFVATGFGHNNGLLVSLVMTITQKLFGMSPEKGSETSIYVASSEELKGVTGKYFDKMRAVQSNAASYDESSWKRLWEISEELTGLQVIG